MAEVGGGTGHQIGMHGFRLQHGHQLSHGVPRQDTSIGRDAVGVVRARHRFDRRRRQSLWRVWRECPWIVGHRLIRIDRWIVVGVWTWLHHASFLHPEFRAGIPNARFCRREDGYARPTLAHVGRSIVADVRAQGCQRVAVSMTVEN